GCADELFDLASQTLVRIVSCVRMRRWEHQQTVFRIVEGGGNLYGLYSQAVVQPQLSPDVGEVMARGQGAGGQNGWLFALPKQTVQVFGLVAGTAQRANCTLTWPSDAASYSM